MNPLPSILDIVVLGFHSSAKYLFGSAGMFVIADAMPEESMLKAASAVTGWVLAIACIWTLVKAVRFLYAKIEEKDKQIAALYEASNDRSDKQRDDMLAELQKIHASQQAGTTTTTVSNPTV